jgi:hypothetical protein
VIAQAYLFLSKIRPTISPNRNYLNQLDKYSSRCERNHCPSFYSSKYVEQEKEKEINECSYLLILWFTKIKTNII